MTNEEMFSIILSRMDNLETAVTGLSGLPEKVDNLETGMTGLSERMDNLETGMTGLSERMDNLESNMDLEFYAVRIEMEALNQSLKKDISIVNDKVDRLMYTKDVDGYEKMKIQVDLLTQGYQDLKEKAHRHPDLSDSVLFTANE